jgi:hypothetical protein
MPKRPAIASDEEDALEATPQSTSKRPRVDGPAEESESAKKRGKRRADRSDDEDVEMGAENGSGEQEEQQFENEHGEKLRQLVQERTKHAGVSAYTVHYPPAAGAQRLCLGGGGERDHRVHRDAPIHVPQIPHFYVRSTNQLYYRP